MEHITLYRPVGLKELELIIQSGYHAFPPRLSWQPIFYPVLSQAYAEKIASEWNVNDAFSGHCGIVTAFDVTRSCFEHYPVKNVGTDEHNELWVPAEELASFNEAIQGPIRIVNAFFGPDFTMPADENLARLLSKFYT
jgi:hypothetical protein